jgi:hypothetical protein
LEAEELQKLMDDLDNTEVHLGNLQADKETLKKTQIPLDIQVKLEEIDMEFEPQMKAVEEEVKAKKDTLQKLLKDYGKPIKSTYYSYTYKDGKPEWNTDALDGYALTHPEILWMRKDGAPVTRLTKLKK